MAEMRTQLVSLTEQFDAIAGDQKTLAESLHDELQTHAAMEAEYELALQVFFCVCVSLSIYLKCSSVLNCIRFLMLTM